MKMLLARTPDPARPAGSTLLIYHRVGAGTRDELDVTTADFDAQLDILSAQQVVPLGEAVDALEGEDRKPRVVLTFDDGFGDVYDNAWPRLRERGIPFTVYLATSYIGGTMSWPGSTAKDTGAPALTWRQLEEMVGSGLCTLGNHTHTHARPELLTETELDNGTAAMRDRLGITPEHFAFPWGRRVPSMETALRARFRSAATGEVGRNAPGTDPMRLRRVPVRGSDPIEFFRAKLGGGLVAERLYGITVTAAKRVGLRA